MINNISKYIMSQLANLADYYSAEGRSFSMCLNSFCMCHTKNQYIYRQDKCIVARTPLLLDSHNESAAPFSNCTKHGRRIKFTTLHSRTFLRIKRSLLDIHYHTKIHTRSPAKAPAIMKPMYTLFLRINVCKAAFRFI